jgi:YD repeat-containing protein
LTYKFRPERLPAVRATRVNHVSIRAVDMEESIRFYEELFGMERVATPIFGGMPVVWLQVGEQQLHLFQQGSDVPRYHHLALDVDDFEAVYAKAKELGVLDSETFGPGVREHPSGWVQMYLRDPAGNLIEVDWPDASTLDRSIVTNIRRLDDEIPQTGSARDATLYSGVE